MRALNLKPSDIFPTKSLKALIPQTGRHRLYWGIALTLLGGLLWGLSGTAGEYLFEVKKLTPEVVIPIRLFVSGFILLLYWLCAHPKKALLPFTDFRDTISMLIYGFAGIMATQYCYFKTISLSNAGTACVLQYLSPIIILAWVCLRTKSKPSIRVLFAVVAACVGVFLVATKGHISTMVLSKEALTWGLTSSFAVALYTVQPNRILQRYPSTVLMGWGMTLSGIFLFIVFGSYKHLPVLDFTTFSMFAIVIVAGTLMSFTFFMEGMKIVGSTKAGLYACVEPVSATIFSALIVGTSFSTIEIIGFCFVLLVPFILDVKFTRKKSASIS